MESFSTFRKSLLTQFMVLLTVDLPEFGTDVFMTIYVVRYETGVHQLFIRTFVIHCPLLQFDINLR
jgi:hypothetical protein